jgi:hypothetical protein
MQFLICSAVALGDAPFKTAASAVTDGIAPLAVEQTQALYSSQPIAGLVQTSCSTSFPCEFTNFANVNYPALKGWGFLPIKIADRSILRS